MAGIPSDASGLHQQVLRTWQDQEPQQRDPLSAERIPALLQGASQGQREPRPPASRVRAVQPPPAQVRT